MSEEEAASAFENRFIILPILNNIINNRKRELFDSLVKTNREKKSTTKKPNPHDKKLIGSDSKDVSVFNTEGKPKMNNFIIFSNNAIKNPNATPSAKSINLSMVSKKDSSQDHKPKRNSSAKKFESPSSFLHSTQKNSEKRTSVTNLRFEDYPNKNSNNLRNPKILNLPSKNETSLSEDRINSVSSNRFGGTGKTNLTSRVEEFMKQIAIPEPQLSNIKQNVQPKGQQKQERIDNSAENSNDLEFIHKMRNKNKEVLGHINNLDSEILRY